MQLSAAIGPGRDGSTVGVGDGCLSRRRPLVPVGHAEQVPAEADPPGQDGVDDHALHPAVPEVEVVLRDVQAEGQEGTDTEQDRKIRERRTEDPEREDCRQGREEERDEGHDAVEPVGGVLREDADPDRAGPRKQDDDHQDPVLERPEDEPGRGQDREAEEDDRAIEDRGTRSHSQIADVVRRDRICRVHRFCYDHGDRELDGAREEEQARPLSVLEAHRRGSWALRLNHFEGPDTSRRTSFSSTSWIAVRNHATATRYLASRSFVSATNARSSSRRTRSGRSSRWTYRMRKS